MDSPPLFTMLERSAAFFPERNAVEFGNSACTYSQLLKQSTLIGASILNSDPLSSSIVGIVGRKSIELLQSLWGALQSRRGYLVLSPLLPLDRNLSALRQCNTSCLIICPGETAYALELLQDATIPISVLVFRDSDREALLKSLPPSHKVSVLGEASIPQTPRSRVNQETVAYICFTSGSTGKPKGVVIGESSVWAYAKTIIDLYEVGAGLRYSLFHELTFDITVHDLYLCFATGGTLCLPQTGDSMAPHLFIRNQQIQAWISVPSVVSLMNGLKALKEGKLPSLLFVFFCGEPLYRFQVEAVFLAAKNARVINLYGPTEATCAITGYECPRDRPLKTRNDIVCLGKVFPGQQALLRGENGKPGSTGELFLGGTQVALGYINDTERTAERFMAIESHPGIRFYRTGDICEADSEGDLFFVGRDDHQIKIRGYRVEIHEIEHAVKELSGSAETVVTPIRSANGEVQELHCFISASAPIEVDSLKTRLGERLPDYMVPKIFHSLEIFPKSPNGKIDRKSLEELAGKKA